MKRALIFLPYLPIGIAAYSVYAVGKACPSVVTKFESFVERMKTK